jgi:hypothetical protein
MRRRAEEQARIRDILVALGGSAEEFDRANDRSVKEQPDLGSRIEAYTRLATGVKAPEPPAAESSPQPPSEPEAQPAVPRRRRARAAPLRRGARLATGVKAPDTAESAPEPPSEPEAKPAPPRRRRARALPLRRAVVAATEQLRRPPRPDEVEPEPEGLAPEVVARLRGYTPGGDTRHQAAAHDGSDDSVSETDDARPAAHRSRRVGWALGGGSAVLTICVVVVAVLVTVRHGHTAAGLHPAPATQATPPRSGFSNPGAYAAAMTGFTLSSVNTKLDGKPTCDTGSTWNRWACQVRARPTLGAYAGRLLTFRCAPAYHQQPGGRPASLMIDCKPTNLPR